MSFDQMPWVIRAENLSKTYRLYDQPHHRLLQSLAGSRRTYYREFDALKDVNFQLQSGETMGIIGANGAGKSTLLQLLCGTLEPTQGQVQVKGRISALLELGAGFNPEFTGRENLVINAAILGLTPAQIEARTEVIIAFADIGEFIDRPVKTYSSGMYVRVAFAVAVHVDPQIMIVDEALAVGDALFQFKCMSRMRRMLDDGVALLFTSHDVSAIKALCQRALWLEKGQVRMLGDTAEVTRAYDQDWVMRANFSQDTAAQNNAAQQNSLAQVAKAAKPSVGTGAVDERQPQDARIGHGARHHGGGREPRQALVTERNHGIAPPAVLLQPDRRCAVGPGQQQPEHGGGEHELPQQRSHQQRHEGPANGDVKTPPARNTAGGNRATRLVDGVDMAVIPVVDRLAGAAHQRARQQHTGKDREPLTGGRQPRGHDAAQEGPHRRKPGDGLQEFKHGGHCGSRLVEHSAGGSCHG